MKRLPATATILMLCACGGEYSGLGSVDLAITSITFRDSNPATITGYLPSGKPADFIAEADDPLISAMTVYCPSPADTLGMSSVNDAACYPLFYSTGNGCPSEEPCRFEIRQMGMSWTPEYSVIRENGLNRVYASVRLVNMTVQTWQADTVRFSHRNGLPVTTATGRITIRQGTSLLPWWNAPAGAERRILSYGWPCPGRWNPLTAVYCPAGGRVESWTGSAFESGDTLYFPADSLLLASLEWEQLSDGYQCFLTLESKAETTLSWDILWPDELPRGADIEPGRPEVQLSPSESVTILYKEVY